MTVKAKPIQLTLAIIGTISYGLFFSENSEGATFPKDTHYTACFSPNGNCTEQITDLIDKAQHTLYMASYSFTSWPIARALLRAKKRGVSIQIITDRSQFKNKSLIPTLMRYKIPIWVDDTVTIAHNKYLIIDSDTLETGSFNYTVSANRYNAENVLIIHNKQLANTYLKNFNYRLSNAKSAYQYHYQPAPYYKNEKKSHSRRRRHNAHH